MKTENIEIKLKLIHHINNNFNVYSVNIEILLKIF